MIKFENTEVFGWEAAIRGMRNPMNSWEKSDSQCGIDCDWIACETCPEHGKKNCTDRYEMHRAVIGPNDHDLMMRLAKGGPVHAKYRRMIVVFVDITAPLYWWKEFDTYKVGTVANSCSTMHKIHAKEFTLEDFSHEHLIDYRLLSCDEIDEPVISAAPHVGCGGLQLLDITIRTLNYYRKKYLETKDMNIAQLVKQVGFDAWENIPGNNDAAKRNNFAKKYWWQMIQLLPSSYNQKRTVMLNYEVLAGIYPSRKNHKLDEWHTFCDWIVGLPYSKIITGEQKDVKNFVGTPAAMGLSFNDQRELCGIPPISHEIVTPDTLEMLKKKLNIASPSGAVRGKRLPTACKLCNKYGSGDSDEEVCKKCQFYLGSKWAKKSDE